MIKIYGSMLCKDCVQCREELDQGQVSYEFLDFGENLLYLKEFLAIRDSNELYCQVRSEGSVGIPCIVKEDGSITLTWEEFLCNRGIAPNP